MIIRFKSIPYKIPGSSKKLYNFDQVQDHKISFKLFTSKFISLFALRFVISLVMVGLLLGFTAWLLTDDLMYHHMVAAASITIPIAVGAAAIAAYTLARNAYITQKIDEEIAKIWDRKSDLEVYREEEWVDFLREINQR